MRKAMATGRIRSLASALATVALLACAQATAQDADWTVPRTAWGDPDMQGVWRYEGAIPLERPARYEGRAFLTDAEMAAIEERETQLAANREAGLDGVAVGKQSLEDSPIRGNEYNIFWQDHGRARQAYRQTSLIVEPEDGRLPYTPDARVAAQRSDARYGVGPYESYLDPDTGERCLTDGVTALMWMGPNGGHNRIVQSEGFVTILHEEYRDRRIIPLDGRAHGAVPQWLGDPVGHWEGDTLVVETENFLDRTNYEWASIWTRASESLKLVERFTRVGENEMEYTVTVEDPKTFTQPWTALVPITRLPEGIQIYEYACHEGNRAMPNLLSAGRADAASN
jgi:hypothetical protein